MSDVIKLDYEKAEEMVKTFDAGKQQLEATLQEMKNIANTLESGALLGDGGQEFREAINGPLCTAISRLSQKFEELSNDVKAAVQDMKQADAESKNAMQS